jgi:CheY-like chemotaxis protein
MPLVMLSSVSVGSDHPQRRAAPIDYYLTKPVRQSDLYDAISTAMSFRKVAAPVAPPPLPGPPALPASLGGRVLVAEDNPVNQQVAAAMLESLGVAYSLAGNGLVALERVLHEQFDLVLMDCQMPEMDGFEATRAVRQKESAASSPCIPIIAMTASAMQADRKKCLLAGMNDFIAKPVQSEELAEMLARWLVVSRQDPGEGEAG